MKTEEQIRAELMITAALASDYHTNKNYIGEQIAKGKLEILEWVLSAKPQEPEPLPSNGSNTIHDNHMHWVKQLEKRGEVILMPNGKPFGSVRGYDKTEIPRENAGAIFQDKNGTFGLFGDMGAMRITGIRWQDLGLCDAACWYEWMNEKKEVE